MNVLFTSLAGRCSHRDLFVWGGFCCYTHSAAPAKKYVVQLSLHLASLQRMFSNPREPPMCCFAAGVGDG
eukprot:1191346-Prorocentrum_minimum.AAC.4